MNSMTTSFRWSASGRGAACSLFTFLLLAFPFRAADTTTSTGATGTLSGSVSSAGTRNTLDGALVELPALRRQMLSDGGGRFSFDHVPTGPIEVAVSYLGLETVRRSVSVRAGERASLDFALLAAGAVQLEKFVVTTEREGQALAVTAQRNAGNVKNVVALDALGNLPNMSAGELAVRLPGVAARLDDEGNVTGVLIRGTPPNLNRVTVDGNLVSNVGGFGRDFQMHSLTGAMFEQLEIVKGQLPDQSADSIGGSVNLKTRSPLGMTERRRFNYSFGARWAPPFFEQTEMRRAHRAHPQLNFGYQEVFDVLGGRRNLGLAVTTFYSENVNVPDFNSYDQQNTAALPAYTWSFNNSNRYSNRRQASFNLKGEYRLAESTKIFANLIYNDANEPFNRVFAIRAFSNQTIAALDAQGNPTGTGAIVPGFTGTFTRVRGVAGSTFEINPLFQTFFQRTRALNTGVEYRRGTWELDADVSYSQTHNNLGAGYNGPGGSLVARVTNVGWTLDNADPANPRFVQTEGPSIFDIANYNNSVQHTVRNDKRNVAVWNGKANAAWRAPTEFPLQLKSGLFFRHHVVEEINGSRRWGRAAGAPPMPAGTSDVTSQEVRMGRDIPFPEPAVIFTQLGNPALWAEDVYYRESQRYSNTRNATEDISAAFVRVQARWGRLNTIAGVRAERTEVEGAGSVRVRPATAVQIPDPVARADHDWNNPVHNRGDYTRSFPSVHLTYDVAENIKARGSWSTSFGRPAFGSLVPAATIDETGQTVTINNPGLGPQYSRNLDLTLEYYFKPAGMASVGYFRKSIRDYILTKNIGVVAAGNDNGYEGDYSGYTLRSQANAGSAHIAGWEVDWRQQFHFLPGLLRGLSASANYTSLTTEGDFGGASVLRTGEVAGFVPRTGNATLSYNYRNVGARVIVNYTGDYLNAFAATPQRRTYRARRVVTNVGASWQFRPQATLFLDVSNIFNETQRRYRYVESVPDYISTSGTAITVGVSGRF